MRIFEHITAFCVGFASAAALRQAVYLLRRKKSRSPQRVVLDDTEHMVNKSLYDQLSVLRTARFGSFRTPVGTPEKDKNEQG